MHRLGRSGELKRLIAEGLRPVSFFPRAWALRTIRKDDTVLVFAGEIDVRVHFSRRATGCGEVNAQGLASAFARELRELADDLGATVVVASVTPASVETSDYVDPDFPRNGTLEERCRWTRLLNAALNEAGVQVIDFHDLYADQQGRLMAGFSDGTVHIRPDRSDPIAAMLRAQGLLK